MSYVLLRDRGMLPVPAASGTRRSSLACWATTGPLPVTGSAAAVTVKLAAAVGIVIVFCSSENMEGGRRGAGVCVCVRARAGKAFFYFVAETVINNDGSGWPLGDWEEHVR